MILICITEGGDLSHGKGRLGGWAKKVFHQSVGGRGGKFMDYYFFPMFKLPLLMNKKNYIIIKKNYSFEIGNKCIVAQKVITI